MKSTPNQAAGLLISRDLFFGSKVSSTALELGLQVDVAGDLLAVRDRLGDYRCVLLDLSTPGLSPGEVMNALPSEHRPHVVAFGAHVHTDRLEQAREAGCNEVLTRGKLSAELPELLRKWLM